MRVFWNLVATLLIAFVINYFVTEGPEQQRDVASNPLAELAKLNKWRELGVTYPPAEEMVTILGDYQLLPGKSPANSKGEYRVTFVHDLSQRHSEAIVDCENPQIQDGRAKIYQRTSTKGRVTYYVRCASLGPQLFPAPIR